MEVETTKGTTEVIGDKVNKSTFTANSVQGEKTKFVIETTGLNNSTIKNEGKGSLSINHQTGDFKKSTIDCGPNKRQDIVRFGADSTLIKGEISLGKGDDTIRFKKNTAFQKKTSVDLGKGGADQVVVKAVNGVEGGKLQITTFTKKDELKIGKTTFDYKDIKGGAELPGNIKVDLA